MVGQIIEKIIKERIESLLANEKEAEVTTEIVQTDNLAEVIEKISILHCRMWYLEDMISHAKNDEEIANLKKKIDICFKVKRPRLVEAINRMIDDAIVSGKSLREDSVKAYQGYE